MSKYNILVIEDDADIQQLVTYNLIKSGMNVTCADNGKEAYSILDREQVDGILLDLMLPGIDGLEICRTIRARKDTQNIPLLMMTAKSEEDDIVTGLELGADDYVTKPFSPKVLVARLQAVLRRNTQGDESGTHADTNKKLSLHGLIIDPGRHEVQYKGAPVQLTGTEFAILHLLTRKAGWVFTRQQIIDQVRGYEYLITPRAVDVQIFGLRKKLGDAGLLIETVRGIGYRIKEKTG